MARKKRTSVKFANDNGDGILIIRTAPVFQPLLKPARYKGAYGGRGSGKSHFFAGMAVRDCSLHKGMSIVCIREVQKTLKESAKRTIEAVLARHGIGERHGFRSYTDRIVTPGGGQIIFLGMQDHTAESLKSLAHGSSKPRCCRRSHSIFYVRRSVRRIPSYGFPGTLDVVLILSTCSFARMRCRQTPCA